MLNPELWIEGGTTMAVGMGIVFSFLVILVFAIMIMAKVVAFINKICPLPVVEAKAPKVKSNDEAEIALAIAIASASRC